MSGFKSSSNRTVRRRIASAVNLCLNSLDSNSEHTDMAERAVSHSDSVNLECHNPDQVNVGSLQTIDMAMEINDDSEDVLSCTVIDQSDDKGLAAETSSASDWTEWTPALDEALEQELNSETWHSDDSCEESTEREESSDIDEVSELINWIRTHDIKQNAVRDLLQLQILRKRNPNLPKDPRTLLETPRRVSVTEITGGRYYYLGVADFVTKTLLCSGYDHINKMKLVINVDGIPLFRSSNLTLWPILGLLKLDDQQQLGPFPIALFCGRSKPGSVDEFFADFVTEMTQIDNNGFHVNNKQVKCSLDAVICDAPARAFVKCCKGHTAYNSCERCIQKGEWLSKMTFPAVNAQQRTDSDFAKQTHESHHVGWSPLCSLSVRMVSQFPLDYMHVVCLGVVRRLILLWSVGPPSCRISNSLILAVSSRLTSYRACIPCEFSRKPRSLCEVKLWKATEFRTFLLYTGPVALKGLLPSHMYSNFLALSVSIFICLSPTLCVLYTDYVEKLLKFFVADYSAVYGPNQVVYNVHCLVHLAQDVMRYGSLDNVSAFPFENYLGHLKTLVRKPHNPVAQIVRRLAEQGSVGVANQSTTGELYKKVHCDGPIPLHYVACTQYKKCVTGQYTVAVTEGDNCFEVSGKVGIVRNIFHNSTSDIGYVAISYFEHIEPFYTKLLSSDILDIFRVSCLSECTLVLPMTKMSRKYLLLPCDGDYAAFPLLHIPKMSA